MGTHMVMVTMVSTNVRLSHLTDTTAMDTQATATTDITDIMVDTPMSTSATTDMDTMVSTNVRPMLSHHMDTTATDTQATAITDTTDIMVDTLMSMSAVITDITAMDTTKEFVDL